MKTRKSPLTPKLRQNWWVDAGLGISAVLAVLSSIYFLVYPNLGYQGGRNPYYNATLIFSKQTWDLLHTWSGVIFTSTALLHIVLHWQWITNITAKMFGAKQQKTQTGQAILEPVKETI